MNFQILNLTPILVITAITASCQYFEKDTSPKDKPIARVDNHYLYYTDIEPLIKSAKASQDSAGIVKNYVDEWVKRKLMLQKALIYLPPEKINLGKQVDDYRESLILYTYEKELILQKMDTMVEESVLRDYFVEYKTNFVLKQDVVQMHYVKVPADAPKIDSLIAWVSTGSEANRLKLEGYCHQYAAEFSLSDSAWHEISSVYASIPVSPYQFSMASLYKKTLTASDSLFNYVLKVNDNRSAGEIAPFDFVKNEISRIILNKRKRELVRSTSDNVYYEGKRNNKFEIYK